MKKNKITNPVLLLLDHQYKNFEKENFNSKRIKKVES